MQDAAHITMILDIATSAWLDFCHKAIYIALRLEESFKKFYGRYQDLIEKYQRSVTQMVTDSFPVKSLFDIYQNFSHLFTFYTRICQYFYLIANCDGVMHEANDAYSIRSTWSCYWLDQFVILALDARILSKCSTLHWFVYYLFFSFYWVLSFLCVYISLYSKML